MIKTLIMIYIFSSINYKMLYHNSKKYLSLETLILVVLKHQENKNSTKSKAILKIKQSKSLKYCELN